MRSLFFCVFLCLVGVIQAAPTTNTTNTTTNDNVKAPSFTTRTLWTIVSSCVLTLFACIYSAVHPNIRSPKDSINDILLRRLGIMIMALIAPELIVTWAMRQLLSARHVTKQFKESGYYPSIHPESEENESVEAPEQRGNRFIRFLAMLAKGILSMLVFVWHFPGALARWVKRLIEAYFSNDSEDYTWTQTHSLFVLMGGFMLYVDGEPYCPLQPDHMFKLICEGCIDAPTLTEIEIDDKSKGNVISKGLVVLQVTWFAMQFVTRIIYHVRITQLEVGTFTFAVFVFLPYAMWWNKPLDVRCPHPVYWKSTESRPEDHIDIPDADELELVQLGIWAPFLRPLLELMGFFMSVPASRRLPVRTSDGSVDPEDSDKVVLVLVVMLLETMFAAMHCMAWSCPFPTYQEQVLWHISTVALICAPWLFTFSLFIANALETSLTSFIRFCALGSIYYVMARAMILVLLLTTLRDLPHDSDVFDTMQWTSLVPHL